MLHKDSNKKCDYKKCDYKFCIMALEPGAVPQIVD